MNNVDSSPSVQEVNIVVRVSVLDLDNSVRFSRQTHGRPRKQSWHTLAAARRPWHQTEVHPLLGTTKQVVNCISLYDVNSSAEQTFKHSANA